MKKLIAALGLFLGTCSAFAANPPILWGPGNAATVIPPVLYVGSIQPSSTLASYYTAGSVIFANSSHQLAGDSTKFFYDDPNDSLRLGTNTTVAGAFNERFSLLDAITSNPSAANIPFSQLATVTGDFAHTQNVVNLRSQYTRTITTSQTDTNIIDGLAIQTPTFTIPAGQTLTNNNATGFSAIRIAAPAASTGTLNFTRYSNIVITASALNTGARKMGIIIGAQTGATNNAAITDNTSFSGSYWLNSTSTLPSLISGDFQINTAGKGVQIKEGSNAKMGTCTLVAGSCTVSNTSVTANSRIFVTSNADGGTPGWLRVSAKTASTSFVVTSSSGTDTSTVVWEIKEAL
jgi:hypothetical protein